MKKVLLWLLVLLVTIPMIATFSLTGCKEAAPVEEVEEAEEAVTAEEAPVEEVGKKYDGVKLRLLTQDGSSYNPFLQAKADEFYDKTGAIIEFDLVPWDALQAKVLSSIQTGEGIYDMFLQDFQFDFSIWPYLIPINSMLEENNVDMSDFFETYIQYGQGFSGEVGVRYGMPLITGLTPIYYNTSLIDGIPDTWDEYFKLLEKNTNPSEGKYGCSLALVPIQLPRAFMTRYWTFGDPLFTTDWKPLINSENGVKALEMLKFQTDNYGPPGMIAWDNFEAAQAFINGDVACYEGWSGLFPEDPADWKIGENWSVSKFPEGATPYYIEHDFVIFKTSKAPEACFEYMLDCTSSESAVELALDYNAIPARKSAYEDKELQEKYPYLVNYVDALSIAKPLMWGLPQWLEMFIYLGDEVGRYMSGEEASAQVVLDSVVDRWEEMLEQNPPQFEYHE